LAQVAQLVLHLQAAKEAPQYLEASLQLVVALVIAAITTQLQLSVVLVVLVVAPVLTQQVLAQVVLSHLQHKALQVVQDRISQPVSIAVVAVVVQDRQEKVLQVALAVTAVTVLLTQHLLTQQHLVQAPITQVAVAVHLAVQQV
jgi:hypothetical protein